MQRHLFSLEVVCPTPHARENIFHHSLFSVAPKTEGSYERRKNIGLVCARRRKTLCPQMKKRLCSSVEPWLNQRTSSSPADKQSLEEKAWSTIAFLLFSLVEGANQFVCFGNSRKVKEYFLQMSAQGRCLYLMLSTLAALPF